MYRKRRQNLFSFFFFKSNFNDNLRNDPWIDSGLCIKVSILIWGSSSSWTFSGLLFWKKKKFTNTRAGAFFRCHLFFLAQFLAVELACTSIALKEKKSNFREAFEIWRRKQVISRTIDPQSLLFMERVFIRLKKWYLTYQEGDIASSVFQTRSQTGDRLLWPQWEML